MDRRAKERRVSHKNSVATRVLLRVSLWSLLFVLVASSIIFVIIYQRVKDNQLAHLQHEITIKLHRNNSFFGRIETHAVTLSNVFLERLQWLQQRPEWVAKFDQWYDETSPGVWRLHPDFYYGTSLDEGQFTYLTSFVGPRSEPLTNDVKNRALAAQLALNSVSPAWSHIVVNSHITLPENVLVQYSTEHPWGLVADKDLDITDYSVVRSTLKKENPERKPNWTGLYYDISAGYWTITYQRPIDHANTQQHLANASFDVGLQFLTSDLVAQPNEQSTSLVLNSSGGLIVASNLAREQLESPRELTPATYKDPFYLKVYEHFQSFGELANGAVLTDIIPDHLVMVYQLEGPGWWYVAIHPESSLRQQAIALPLQLVMVSAAIVLMILVMVYWLVTRDVSKPLRAIAKVASMLDQENYRDVLRDRESASHAYGEVRLVLNAFRTSALRFLTHNEELEFQVSQRTEELAQANRQLENLASMDGLTNLKNRRMFNIDLENLLAQDEINHVLIMVDIDSFKEYNDNYGHEFGDQALQKISRCFSERFPDSSYRYGGEELAVILPLQELVEQPLVAEELCKQVYDLNLVHDYHKAGLGRLTVCIGVASILAGDNQDSAIRRADVELYVAKANQGNQVCYSAELASRVAPTR